MIKPFVWVCPPGTPKGVTPSAELGCVRLKALIDTGAECSFVNAKKLEKLKGYSKKGCSRLVSQMCGGRDAAVARGIDVQMIAPGCPPAKVCALGVGGQPVEGVDLVVGYDYMKKVGLWVKVAPGRGGGTFGCTKAPPPRSGTAKTSKVTRKPRARAAR